MKFLLSNYKRKEGFSIRNINGRCFIRNKIDKVEYVGSEVNSPAIYYTCVFKDGKINKTSFEEAKLLKVEAFVENNAEPINDEVLYEQFIDEFGAKAAKNALKRRAIDKAPPAQKIKYNIENSLIPDLSSDVNLSSLFEKQFVDKSKEIVNSFSTNTPFVDICEELELPPVETVAEENEVVYFEKKCYLIFIDYLFKVLGCKIINKSELPDRYLGFYGLIAGELSAKRLSRLSRDRLTSKLYVLILLYCNKKCTIQMLPRFNFLKSRQINLLKAIGCTIGRNEDVTME